MGDCTDCRYKDNMCKWPCDDCVKGDKWEKRPFTNEDCLNAMTAEEKAKWFEENATGCPPSLECYGPSANPSTQFCIKCWLDWLNKTASDTYWFDWLKE